MKFSVGAALSLWAAIAFAADKPQSGPPAAWVKPAALTMAPGPARGAFQLLLIDTQDRYAPGEDQFYQELAVKVLTPEGLIPAGNVNLVWNPFTDSVTVHKLHIIRGGQVVDVLKTQSFTVVQREKNLELSVLDGTLTGTLQPEGLQVGDVVDLAYTITRKDPVLQGRSERLQAVPTELPIQRLRIRETWPAGANVRVRQARGLAKPVLARTAEGAEATIDMSGVELPKPPKFAPARYGDVGQVEASGFKSWAEVSAIAAPLFAKASTLRPDSPLRAEVAKLKALSTDPKVRAMAALRLVEDNVRYVLLGLNVSGYTPAAADDTWTRRFGDCKAKTALLIALLRELGVEAEPALVSTAAGDGLDQRLPMLEAFDHVLVRSEIGGKVYWLDGSRLGDRDLGHLPIPNDHWALPVRASGAQLIALSPPPLELPSMTTSLHLDATAGLDAPAPAHGEMVFRGDAATQLKLLYDSVAPAAADEQLRQIWKAKYDWIEVKKVQASFDPSTGEARLSMDGTAKMAWDVTEAVQARRYEADGAVLGWKADFTRDPGPLSDVPYAVAYPTYTETKEIIVLPANGRGFRLDGGDIDETAAGIQLKRRATLDNGVFTMTASARAIEPEFPASQAAAAAQKLQALARNDLYIRAPATYEPTAADAKALDAKAPSSAEEFVARGEVHRVRMEFDQALSDYDAALKLDPSSADAWAGRGMVHALRHEIESAKPDVDKALQLAPNNRLAWEGRASIALDQGDCEGAEAAFSRSLAIEPNNTFDLRFRGLADACLKKLDKAKQDLLAAEKLDPDDPTPRAMLVQVFARAKDAKAAGAYLDELVHWGRAGRRVYLELAAVLLNNDMPEQARKAVDAAIADKASAQAYSMRAMTWDKAHGTQREADLAQAAKLDPLADQLVVTRAQLHVKDGDMAAAVRELDGAISKRPDDEALRNFRFSILQDVGRFDEALADINVLIGKHPKEPVLLNNRCWLKAIFGKDLRGAKADCDAAIAGNGQIYAFWDSRGLVDLKAGRAQAAIGDYEVALRLHPKTSSSLFGRALAEFKLGKTDAALADVAAAKQLDPKIAETFQRYGVAPQGPALASADRAASDPPKAGQK